MNLKEIGQIAHDINEANGFGVFHTSDWPRTQVETTKIHALCTHTALFHTEIAEATEAVRHLDKPNFEEELADVIIRVTSVAHGLGLDLDATVQEKMNKNRTRGLRHGGKAV